MYELTNKKLTTQTKLIQAAIDSGVKSTLKIARILSKVKKEELYKDDFKSMTEYGECVFGYKPDTVSKMCAIGERFVKDDFTTIFDTETQKFTSGQLIELLPLADEDIKALPNVSADMTTKEIRAEVKDYRNSKNDDAKPVADRNALKKRKLDFAKMAKQLADILPNMFEVLPLFKDAMPFENSKGEVTGYDFDFTIDDVNVTISVDIDEREENE